MLKNSNSGGKSGFNVKKDEKMIGSHLKKEILL
jgi:hypothetical protein